MPRRIKLCSERNQPSQPRLRLVLAMIKSHAGVEVVVGLARSTTKLASIHYDKNDT